jgi:hypothetical protein
MDALSDVERTILFLATVVCLGVSVIASLSDLEKVRSGWIENRRQDIRRKQPGRREPASQHLEL